MPLLNIYLNKQGYNENNNKPNYLIFSKKYIYLQYAIRNSEIANYKYTKMIEKSRNLKPQDIVILCQILSLGPIYTRDWDNLLLSRKLNISQSEISQSIRRSIYIGFMDAGKSIYYESFFEFLVYGLKYVFPVKPGAISRGVPTAHSAGPLNMMINSNDNVFVWPYAFGKVSGESIEPLYHTIPKVISEQEHGNIAEGKKFYELLALLDALRAGRARERNIAKSELEKRIIKNIWK